ncbi:MAG: hypothetical protein LBV74_18110 [Tannerella sp.]|jgi:antitoxin component YwqK of YwqJK toxin-antitoxin module|nr:hypothetical protein [Tannerella sp.]
MMKSVGKIIALLLLSLCLSTVVNAQVEDGVYYAFRTVKAGQLPDVITIQVLTIGDRIRQFTDVATKKALDGEYHIAISNTRYAIGNLKKGILDGNWTQYWNNKVEEKGTYKEGRLDGAYWSDTSEGHDEYVFKNGKVVSLVSWYDNGQLIQEQRRDENGELHGEIVYYLRDGKILSRLNYVHGVQEGPQMNGRQNVETYTLKNGKKVGEYSQMTHRGGLMERGTFDDQGTKIGTWHYGNGNDYVAREESYWNGMIHGERKQYYSNGAPWKYEEYVDGKRHGKSIDYDRDNSKPSREYMYRNDKKHGEFKVWYNDHIERSGIYKDDKLVMEKRYYAGKLTDIYLLDETGSLTKVEGYNNTGQRTYRNATFKKHPSITLRESDSGVIDIEIE